MPFATKIHLFIPEKNCPHSWGVPFPEAHFLNLGQTEWMHYNYDFRLGKHMISYLKKGVLLCNPPPIPLRAIAISLDYIEVNFHYTDITTFLCKTDFQNKLLNFKNF